MTTAVPDPRFRDQLLGALVRTGVFWPLDVAEIAVDALLPLIAAEVEARVQAAANQRAAQALTDAWPSVWAVLDRFGHGQSYMAVQASEVVHARAAALHPLAEKASA